MKVTVRIEANPNVIHLALHEAAELLRELSQLRAKVTMEDAATQAFLTKCMRENAQDTK